MRKAVFFDRDGVLNKAIIIKNKPFAPKDIDQLIVIKEAHAIFAQLKKNGFLLLGVTNQPDVARGITAMSTVQTINNKIIDELSLDEIRVCYHDDHHDCTCRKPKPGLLQQCAQDYGIDLAASFMVGDRWKDIEAGKSAGCKTIWLHNDYDEQKPINMDYKADDVIAASRLILDVTTCP